MELNAFEYSYNYDVSVSLGGPEPDQKYVFKLARPTTYPTNALVLEVPLLSTDWLTLRVETSCGTVWDGVFEPGVEGISGVYATPSENVMCVVVKGQGYWVPVDSPGTYEVVRSTPIKQVFAVPDADIMIFVDFVRIAAYGAEGFAWQTDDLTWDGITITEISTEVIRGVGWDAPNDSDAPFTVDVASGSHEGGARPQKR